MVLKTISPAKNDEAIELFNILEDLNIQYKCR